MPTIVKLIWKCAMPTTKKLIQLCESLMIKAAKGHGMDTAIIRQVNTQMGPHNTTRVNGRYVCTIPHITGNIVNTKVNEGYALHWNLNAKHTAALPSRSPNAPNPEFWKLKYKYGKG
ncbi:hypothetical protein BJV77DRAFT_914274, partial [Russula vinacea]